MEVWELEKWLYDALNEVQALKKENDELRNARVEIQRLTNIIRDKDRQLSMHPFRKPTVDEIREYLQLPKLESVELPLPDRRTWTCFYCNSDVTFDPCSCGANKQGVFAPPPTKNPLRFSAPVASKDELLREPVVLEAKKFPEDHPLTQIVKRWNESFIDEELEKSIDFDFNKGTKDPEPDVIVEVKR